MNKKIPIIDQNTSLFFAKSIKNNNKVVDTKVTKMQVNRYEVSKKYSI